MTYRFAALWPETVGQELEWLCKELGDSKNSTVAQAVHEMYQRMRAYTLVVNLGAQELEKEQGEEVIV